MMKRTLTATITAALVLTGCTGTVAGSAVRDPHAAPTTATSTAAATVEPGLRENAASPTVSVIETAPGAVNAVAAQAFSDVIDFWESTDPRFSAPQRLEAMPGPLSGSSCMSDLEVAKRCENGIGWETTDLTAIHDAAGDLGVLTVVAHELGHEVQDDNQVRLSERGADCLAGVYLGRVVSDGSTLFAGSQEDVIAASRLAFSTFPPTDTTVEDRLTALRNGLARSMDFCLVKYR